VCVAFRRGTFPCLKVGIADTAADTCRVDTREEGPVGGAWHHTEIEACSCRAEVLHARGEVTDCHRGSLK